MAGFEVWFRHCCRPPSSSASSLLIENENGKIPRVNDHKSLSKSLFPFSDVILVNERKIGNTRTYGRHFSPENLKKIPPGSDG